MTVTQAQTSPWQRYQNDLKQDDFSHDPAQEQAVLLLQDLYERLIAAQQQPPAGLRGFLRKLKGERPEPEMGLYLWGGVGRGKGHLQIPDGS